MIRVKIAAGLAVALLVAGCSSESGAPADSAAARDHDAVEPTVFDPMVQSLDKARGVEEKVTGRAADLRSRVDDLDQRDEP